MRVFIRKIKYSDSDQLVVLYTPWVECTECISGIVGDNGDVHSSRHPHRTLAERVYSRLIEMCYSMPVQYGPGPDSPFQVEQRRAVRKLAVARMDGCRSCRARMAPSVSELLKPRYTPESPGVYCPFSRIEMFVSSTSLPISFSMKDSIYGGQSF